MLLLSLKLRRVLVMAYLAPLIFVLAWPSARGELADAVRRADIERLKREIHTLHPAEAAARMAAIRHLEQPPPRQSKIDHFVVLYMENHAFDHFLGCMDLPGADGIPRSGRLIPKDPNDPSKGHVNVTCGTAQNVCSHGPGYDFFHSKFKKGANSHEYPYDAQSDNFSYINGAKDLSIKMFAPEQLPVKYSLAKNFGVFNKLYSASPTMSWPNHMFTQSATSCGITETGTHYDKCGGNTTTFPQFTIYDTMRLDNVSFGRYTNCSCGVVGQPPCKGTQKRCFVDGLMMAGVGRHSDRFFGHTEFYQQAAAGKLPSFSWFLPPNEATDHPCNDVAKGERVLKDVYEALRAGPAWNRTLFTIVYDDTGAYYDHVIPPSEGVPADDAPCHSVNSGCKIKFDFRRLGNRVTGMLMSPWVAKGSVFQEPKKGPSSTSHFELTSVAATVKSLFNLTTFLTKRDAWAGSFEELLLDSPRTDEGPMQLPEAPKPAKPWGPPHDKELDGNAEDEDDDEEEDGRMFGARRLAPRHCSLSDECSNHMQITKKQRRSIQLMAKLTQNPEPDVETMNTADADDWLTSQFEEWRSMGSPIH